MAVLPEFCGPFLARRSTKLSIQASSISNTIQIRLLCFSLDFMLAWLFCIYAHAWFTGNQVIHLSQGLVPCVSANDQTVQFLSNNNFLFFLKFELTVFSAYVHGCYKVIALAIMKFNTVYKWQTRANQLPQVHPVYQSLQKIRYYNLYYNINMLINIFCKWIGKSFYFFSGLSGLVTVVRGLIFVFLGVFCGTVLLGRPTTPFLNQKMNF